MTSRNGAEESRKVLVVGMGVSGRSACELLLREGSEVIATDLRPWSAFNGLLENLKENGCALHLGGHDTKDFLSVDQIVVSPGVPLDIEPLESARRRGIEIIGELEWASRRVSAPIVGVTGTNGKTTTTSLIGEILKAAGKRVFVGGNIGTPLAKWVLDGEEADFLVLEISSFQLDTATLFRPDVGVLLNVTEDHLDRYRGYAEYVDSKFSIFARQYSTDVAVLNGDDPICLQRAGLIKGRLLVAGRRNPQAHAFVDGDEVTVRIPWRNPFTLNVEKAYLKGVHNEENILAACLAAGALGVNPEPMQKAVEGYRGLPHRVEWVRCRRGVDFYDDSKGTNVGAVIKAMENFDRPVLLLLGGRDKLGSYAPLAASLKERGKAAFAFGEAAPRMIEELEGMVPIRSFPDLEAAFWSAVGQAAPGDVVLLSPACSSFDQYESYAHRGDHFKRLVNLLSE